MDLWIKWVCVIVGIFFVSVIIILIFVLINKCISRRGKHRISQLQRRPDFTSRQSNKYQENDFKAAIPPLPARTQFVTAEAQSYENLAEAPDNDYEQSTPDYEQSMPVYQQDMPTYQQCGSDYEQSGPDYEQSGPDYEQSGPDYEQSGPDYEQSGPDYEQSGPDYEQSGPDYEQSGPDYVQTLEEQPDYVTMEDENEIPLPPPPYTNPDFAADNDSTEDYDDIGDDGEEDYDDVG